MTFALKAVGLEKRFDRQAVTRDLSLRIEAGARNALIGPNGACKTTVINLLTGVQRPNGGRILLEGNDITALPAHRRVRRGLSRTFQINQLYADLTPLESIGLAVSERMGHGGDWWRHDVLAVVASLPRDVTVLLIEHAWISYSVSPIAFQCWSPARCWWRDCLRRWRAIRASRPSISAKALRSDLRTGWSLPARPSGS